MKINGTKYYYIEVKYNYNSSYDVRIVSQTYIRKKYGDDILLQIQKIYRECSIDKRELLKIYEVGTDTEIRIFTSINEMIDFLSDCGKLKGEIV